MNEPRQEVEGFWYTVPVGKGFQVKIQPLTPLDTLRIFLNLGSDSGDVFKFLRAIFDFVVDDWRGVKINFKKATREQVLDALFREADVRDFVLKTAFLLYELTKIKPVITIPS